MDRTDRLCPAFHSTWNPCEAAGHGQAFTVVEHWIANPAARILHPTARHGAILRRLLMAAGTAGNLTTDAHLAALAIEHGGTVGSFDRDFERFPGVDFELLKA
jgi:predicted nucleic acid-binding protein